MALKTFALVMSLSLVYLSGKRFRDKEYRDDCVFWFGVTLLFFAQLIVVLFYLLSS
jgi:hypothetical protein